MTATRLEYGREARINYARLARRAALVLAVLVVVVIGGWYGLKRLYYADRYRAASELNRIPGAHVVDVRGHDDITYKVLRGTVELDGRPGEVVCFAGRDFAPGSGRVCIEQIGPYRFEVDEFGYVGVFESATGKPMKSRAYRNWINVHPSGEFAHLIPFPIRSADDVVKNYDALVQAIGQLPPAGQFTGKSGNQYSYRIK